MKSIALSLTAVRFGGLGLIGNEFLASAPNPAVVVMGAFMIVAPGAVEMSIPVPERKKVVSDAGSVKQVHRDHKVRSGRVRTDWVQFEKDITRAVFAEEEDTLGLKQPPSGKPGPFMRSLTPAERERRLIEKVTEEFRVPEEGFNFSFQSRVHYGEACSHCCPPINIKMARAVVFEGDAHIACVACARILHPQEVA